MLFAIRLAFAIIFSTSFTFTSIGMSIGHLAYFTISKLRNEPKHFLKFYQTLLLLSDYISLNPGPCQFIDDKAVNLLEFEV